MPCRKHGPTRRDRSYIGDARFLDMPRRIAQERVPTASNVGSRDVTWASQPIPLFPFRVFSRVSRAPFLRQIGPTRTEDRLGGTGQILPLPRFLDMPRRIARERVPIMG